MKIWHVVFGSLTLICGMPTLSNASKNNSISHKTSSRVRQMKMETISIFVNKINEMDDRYAQGFGLYAGESAGEFATKLLAIAQVDANFIKNVPIPEGEHGTDLQTRKKSLEKIVTACQNLVRKPSTSMNNAVISSNLQRLGQMKDNKETFMEWLGIKDGPRESIDDVNNNAAENVNIAARYVMADNWQMSTPQQSFQNRQMDIQSLHEERIKVAAIAQEEREHIKLLQELQHKSSDLFDQIRSAKFNYEDDLIRDYGWIKKVMKLIKEMHGKVPPEEGVMLLSKFSGLNQEDNDEGSIETEQAERQRLVAIADSVSIAISQFEQKHRAALSRAIADLFIIDLTLSQQPTTDKTGTIRNNLPGPRRSNTDNTAIADDAFFEL